MRADFLLHGGYGIDVQIEATLLTQHPQRLRDKGIDLVEGAPNHAIAHQRPEFMLKSHDIPNLVPVFRTISGVFSHPRIATSISPNTVGAFSVPTPKPSNSLSQEKESGGTPNLFQPFLTYAGADSG